ncbi:AAA family ATPase [Shigella flexneri]|nr:AAA family ATPase [Shigella flexneri]
MRLRKLKLKNFRGYRNSTEIIIDESMTGIVGRNDFGKSTLLEALAIFFETEGMKADKNDMNCFSLREGDGRFEIACEFDDLPDFIMIDDRVQTTLASEHLLNEDGNFEIVKTFKATTSGKPEQTCIRCIHPDEEPLRNLLGMKISELKAVGKEVEKNVADKRTASLWRQAIREAAAPYIGGDPAQVLSIQKRKKEVEEAGKVFFATRKREIENYLCPDLIEEITGVAVTFTDTCDAKKIIGRAVGMKPDNVLDKFWPQMTSERIISRSTYHDGTQERSELVEILSDIVSMTR